MNDGTKPKSRRAQRVMTGEEQTMTFRIEPETARKIRSLAVRNERSVAAELRVAVRYWAERHHG